MADHGPAVTALREEGRRVRVHLDGADWRTLPVEVVARAGLRVGERLDRPRLRELRRELRRAETLSAATRALRHRDLSAQALSERLARAGATADERGEALAALERVGYLDDRRLAAHRAETMAARGWGDAAIAADLERRGVDAELGADAIGALEPERERALRIARERGRTRATTARLARRGFGEDALEAALGSAIAEDG